MQALKNGIRHVEGVILTHAHHDHTGGIDDLRMHYMWTKEPIPCLMSEVTSQDIQSRYPYLFQKEEAKTLVAKFAVELLPADRGEITFRGIPMQYFTYEQTGMAVNGFRVGDFAYVSDIRKFPETVYEDLAGVRVLVLSALRMTPSHIHFSVDEAVEFGKKVGAEKVWLTHIAHDLDHIKTNTYLPENVRLAYDGLELSFE